MWSNGHTPAQYYSIDVECVATGLDHNSRAVGQVALVDAYEQVLLNIYVKPEQPVVSYLTDLTGLSQEMVTAQGVSLAEAIDAVRAALPSNAVLVGQNILMDVQWLGLKEGVDFASCMDLAGMYRVWNPKYNSWSVFSQDQVAKVLLGWDVENTRHDAVWDALKSVQLFKLHHQLQADPDEWERAQQLLLNAPPLPSFAKKHPTYEGVCMGNRRTCQCGAPFFS